MKDSLEISFSASYFPIEIIGEVYDYFLKKGADELKLIYYDDEIEGKFSKFIIQKGREDTGKFFIAKFNEETKKILDNQIMPIFGTIDLYIFENNKEIIYYNEAGEFIIKNLSKSEFEEIKKIFEKHAKGFEIKEILPGWIEFSPAK